MSLYVAFALGVTYPLVAHLGDRLAGNSPDIFIYPWGTWWLTESVRRGEALFFTPFLYFPEGASLAFHNLVLPATGWALLLPRPLNLIAFHNVLILAGFVTSALAACALALFLTRSRSAAFLAGVIFGFAPYRVEQARSHLTTVTALWLPLFLLAFFWLCASGTRRRRVLGVLAAAVCAVLALLTRADHMIAGMYVLGFFVLYPPFARARMAWRARLGWTLAVACCTIVLALPYFSLWAGHEGIPKPPRWKTERESGSVSVEKVVTPAPGSLLWGWWRPATTSADETAKVAFVGFGLLLMLGAGAYWLGRDRAWRFWVGAGLLLVVVSLGPHLVVYDHATRIPLGYDLLPGIAEVRNPRRFMSAAMLCLAVAAALSWRALVTRIGRGGARAGLTLGMAALLLLEYAAPPLPTTRPAPSPFYGQLATSPETFGLVEIPSNTRVQDKAYMFYQTLHGKPIHAGHMARIPEETFHFIRAVGLLNFVAHEGRVAPAREIVDVSQDLDILRANGFRFIIFHKRFAEGALFPGINQRETRLLSAVARAIGPPAYEDDLIVAFDLRRLPSVPVRLAP